MPSRLACARAFAAALATASLAPAARAGERFEACFESARAALTSGAAGAARTGFEVCLEVADPGPERWRALLGLALSRHAAGDLPLALASYHRFLDESVGTTLAGWPERRATAEAEAASLREKVLVDRAEVKLLSDTPGVAFTVDGAAPAPVQAVLPAWLYLAPGVHELALRADGHAPEIVRLELAAGQAVMTRRDLTPLPAAEPAPPDVGPDPVPDPVVRAVEPLPPPPVDYTPHVVIGGGVALLATGAVFTGLALADAGELEDLQDAPLTDAVRARDAKLRSRVDDYQTVSWICYGAGAVAVGVGIALAVTGGDDGGAPAVDVIGAPGGGLARFRVGF